MPRKLGPIHWLLAELRRRHVLRVMGSYAVTAWLILEVSSVIFPPLQIPEWVMTLLVILIIAGFPIVVVFSWAFDITASGLVRTDSMSTREYIEFNHSWRWIDYAIIFALLCVIAFMLYERHQLSVQQRERSIAVLPFSDLSSGGNNRYFSDGMSEAIINSLAKIPELRVISGTSSFGYRGSDKNIRQIGKELGVSTILEGSVRKSEDRVRIDVRLTDSQGGHHLWSETFDETLDDIFAVQDQISRAITNTLSVDWFDSRPIVENATGNQTAYDNYLRGKALLREEQSILNFDQAKQYFNIALQQDKNFALAEAGLCKAHWQHYEFARITDEAELALQRCNRAIELDNSLVETHLALGNIYRGRGEYEKAEIAFQRAQKMQPNNAEVLSSVGQMLREQGDYQAARSKFDKAIELDPGFWRHYSQLATTHLTEGNFDQAAVWYQKAIALESESALLYSNLGAVYFYSGKYLLAADTLRKSIGIEASALGYSNAGTNYFFGGNFSEAVVMFEKAVELAPEDYRMYGNLGDALIMLEDAQQQAQDRYRQATELAIAELEINPGDAATYALLAFYWARLDEKDKALRELVKIDVNSMQGMETLFHAGLAYHLLEDYENSAEYIQAAVAAGFPRELVTINPIMADAEGLPGFGYLTIKESSGGN